jgi:hypothetical protein
VGLRVRTGFAIVVAIDNAATLPLVVDRRRVELVDPRLPRQVYHAAVGLPLGEAERLVAEVVGSAEAAATAAVAGIVDELGSELRVAIGVRRSNARPKSLAAILRSHTALHAAEGELYRDALLGAAHAGRLDVHAVPEDDAAAVAAGVLGMAADQANRLVAELGRPFGPPWTKDQKIAALLALAVAGH